MASDNDQASVEAPAPSYVALVKENKEFRLLWLGTVVSFAGDWFTLIALFTLVQEITDSAAALAAVLIAKTLPFFLVAPIAGPLIDRYDRRRILIASDLARFVCAVLLVVVHRAESLPLLVVVLTVMVCFSGIFVPARTAVIPQLTTRAELPVAMALSAGTWSVMLAFGAAIGGGVTELLGVDGSLLADAVTFLVSAAFLAGLPSLPPSAHGVDHDSSFRDGLRHLRGQVYLPALLLLKTGLTAGSAALVALPIYGNGLFPRTAGPLWLGFLYGCRGVGALVGSMGLRRVFGDRQGTYRALIVPGYLIMGTGLLLAAWAPGIGWAGVGYGLSAVGNGAVWTFASTLSQHITHQEYRGRLYSMEFGLFTLSAAVGYFLSGQAMDLLGAGPRVVVAASGVILVVPAALWTGVLALASDVRDHPSER